MNTMQIPMLKRQAERFHQKHDAMRRKAIAEEEEAKQKIYKAKGRRTVEAEQSNG